MTDDFDDLYGSKYLSAADLKGQPRRVKIGKTDVADFNEKNGGTKRKYILFFEGEDKAMVLNKTNAQKLAQAYGKERTGWVGQFVELYSEPTSYGEGLRLRPLRKASTPAQPDPEMNDAIPILTNKRAASARRGSLSILRQLMSEEGRGVASSGSRHDGAQEFAGRRL